MRNANRQPSTRESRKSLNFSAYTITGEASFTYSLALFRNE